MWIKCHSFAAQDYFTSMWNTFSVCLSRSAEVTEAISLALHSVSLVHPTPKIWRDFSTSSPSLIFRELWLPFMKLYIFHELKNVQSTLREFYGNWFSTGTLGIFATLVYVFTMRVYGNNSHTIDFHTVL